MSDDLVKRLESGYVSSGLMREAASRIEALEAENKRLREIIRRGFDRVRVIRDTRAMIAATEERR